MVAEKKATQGKEKKKVGVFIPLVQFLSLISSMKEGHITPKEVICSFREEFGCEIDKNGDESVILDNLAQVKNQTLASEEFLVWFKEWLNKTKERI